MVGGSYMAHAQFLAAIKKPPHLTTIIPHNLPADPFKNSPYENGIFLLAPELWWINIIESAIDVNNPAAIRESQLKTWISRIAVNVCLTYLSKAKNKLAFLNLTDWFIIISLLLILGTGGGFILVESLLKYTDNLTLLIIIWIIFFISLCVFGIWTGKRNWEKTYGDLLEKITEMKNSYSGNHDTID
jgi:hypothetical protein